MRRLLRRICSVALATLAVAAIPFPASAADAIKVVATFSVLGDMVKNIAGERVALTTLVGPNGEVHGFEPTPADARALAEADLVVVNGLGFEGWLERLVKASGYEGPVVVATDGVVVLKTDEGDGHGDAHDDHEKAGKHDDHDEHDKEKKHDDHASHDAHEKEDKHEGHADSHDDHEKDGKHGGHAAAHDEHEKDGKDGHHHHHHGEFDPHAWHDVAQARIYIENIARGLAAVDAAHADGYNANAKAYDRKLTALDEMIRARFNAIPSERRQVVTAHDAFQYFGRAYGIEFHAPLGLSPESEASAGEVAKLIRQMRQEGIRALFLDNVTDPRMLRQLAREADAVIGGTLYSDSLSPSDGPASTYLGMLRHNAGEIAKAMQD